MKTVIVNIPEKEENFFLSLLKKFHFKSRVLTDEDLEDEKLARLIDKGMKSEDVRWRRFLDPSKKMELIAKGEFIGICFV